MKIDRFLKLSLVTALAGGIGLASSARAGSFYSDFNSGLPSGTAVYGNTTVAATGGYTNSGCLKLTTAVANQTGGFIITNDFDGGAAIYGFTANFKVLAGGGTGADGFSFNWSPTLALGTLGENGSPSGLAVSFDTYSNDAGDPAPSVTVLVDGGQYGEFDVPLRLNKFVDVVINLRPDGMMTLYYDSVAVFTNLFVGNLNYTGALFGLGARTGGSTDNHFVDNLSIVTETNQNAFVQSFSPRGSAARADSPLTVVLTDFMTQVNTNTIVMQLDGTNVDAGISQDFFGNTTVTFVPPALFPSGSSHFVNFDFSDNASPTPKTNNLQYGFTVAPFSYLSTNLIVSAALVNTNTPGFDVRVTQIEPNFGPTIARAEKQLAGLIIDPNTSMPYPNVATPNPDNGTFIYPEGHVINYSYSPDQGSIPGDAFMPGIPGATGSYQNMASEAITYLYLTNGLYSLGVNSSDGFRLTVAGTPDLFATEAAVFDGVRAAASTTTIFGIAQAGFYPFRITYFSGGTEAVNPGTVNPSVEFFSVDANGTSILINDTNTPGALPAYRAAGSLPHIRSVSPSVAETGVPRVSPIDITLVDGTITVQTNTILMQLNGTTVTPAISAAAGVITVHYQPPTQLALNSSNTVLIAFTDSASNRRTNSYQFTVENILTQLWAIGPTQSTNVIWAKWVTSLGTERGIAYNPKTKHVLIVSRNTAAGADGPNGLGVGVFDGDTGLYIKQLDVGLITSTGVGTFRLNMIDVADDGVIYACNLDTSAATVLYKIYRWQDENSAPTEAFSGTLNGTGVPTRVGDDFVVRGSGAGTQILSSGNSASHRVPLFTTTNGVDYSITFLDVAGLPDNVVRLGLAFGCGNAFYGETIGNGNPVRYSSFVAPGLTNAMYVAGFTITDAGANQAIGPIGVDIINQRLIGDATSGGSGVPHSMNLFDLNLLAPTPAINSPVDSKPFPTSAGTFGTGAIDFTPDGARVYTLDSGSGVIAFSLAPKLAAPIICADPVNHIIPLGNLGFFSVGAIGAPQAIQWRKDGIAIAGATNRTIDIPNVQMSNLGRYTVVITNSMGSVTSAVALLDIPIQFMMQPTDQITPVNGSAAFTVAVTGNGPFTYQWKLNGTNVTGGTSATLNVMNAQQANAGSYTVVVTDQLGQAATSSAAALTVGTLGTGTGLNGDYYSFQLMTFTNAPTLSRVDPTINFDFGTGAPDPIISVDTFTVRWSGQVQPLYSQTYTFYTRTDDGVRLWVNGQKLIEKFVNQGPTEWSGSIALNANQKYSILMEYFENTGSAVASLSWASLGQVKQIIPMTQLYPGTPLPVPAITVSKAGPSSLVLSWAGTYTLQSALNVEGPYADVVPTTNPYTNSLALPKQFFRLISP